MMDTTELEYFICRVLKRVLFLSCRFPAFKYDYIVSKIDRPTTSKEELESYMSNCTRTRRKHSIVVALIYIVYCIKNAFIPYISFKSVNYEQLVSNIRVYTEDAGIASSVSPAISRATSLKQFSCMWTNCSRLSPQHVIDVDIPSMMLHTEPNHEELAELARDIAALPLFTLCHPRAEILYTPGAKLDTLGILISAVACLNVVLLGAYTTTQQIISPAPNETIMFVCAPRICMHLARLRAGQLFLDLVASFHNFRFKPVWRRKRANSIRRVQAQWQPLELDVPNCLSSPVSPISDPTTTTTNNNNNNNSKIELKPGQMDAEGVGAAVAAVVLRKGSNAYGHRSSLRIRALIGHADAIQKQPSLLVLEPGSSQKAARHAPKRHGLSFEGRTPDEVREIMNNCLPIIKTEWWRPHLARILNHTLVVILAVFSTMGMMSIGYITYRGDLKHQELVAFAREIRRQNCSLWRHTVGELPDDSEESYTVGPKFYTTRHQAARAITGEIVQLDAIKFEWTPLSMVFALVNLVPGFTVSLLLAYYWASLAELSLWLAELRMFLVASLVVAKFKVSPSRQPDPDNKLSTRPRGGAKIGLAGSRLSVQQLALGGKIPWRNSLAAAGTGRESSASLDADPLGAWLPASSSPTSSLPTHRFFALDLLRQRFQHECWFLQTGFVSCLESGVDGTFELTSMNSKYVDHYHFQQFARELLSDSSSMEANNNNNNNMTVSLGRATSPVLAVPLELQPEYVGHAHRASSLGTVALLVQPAHSQTEEHTSELECMEQIYVNFRLFVDHVKSCSPSIRMVLAITYGLNYGLAFISIICMRKIASLMAEPLTVIFFGWLISNCVIILAANFHADAKKLQPLLWSIIAQLTHSDDMRVQHLRYLWTKQVRALDDAGGLSLTALGLRVTYVNIIQLALGTATILVISVRPG